MTVVEIVLGIVLIVMSLGISVLVMLQPGKDKRLSGALSGGASSETFFGKGKAQRREKKLEKATILVSVVFFIAIVALYCIV